MESPASTMLKRRAMGMLSSSKVAPSPVARSRPPKKRASFAQLLLKQERRLPPAEANAASERDDRMANAMHASVERWSNANKSVEEVEIRPSASERLPVESPSRPPRLREKERRTTPDTKNIPESLSATIVDVPSDDVPTGKCPTRSLQDVSLCMLYLNCERTKKLHRLAAEYLHFWHFFFLFVPSVLLTMLAGVLSFVATNSNISSKVQNNLIVSVGILALVSVFWQSVSQNADLRTRAKMHDSAAFDLTRISDRLFYETVRRIHMKESKLRVESYEQLFAQIHASCKSSVPLRIAQAFAVCESRFKRREDILRFDAELDVPKIMSDYKCSMTELQGVVSSYKYWPLRAPNPSEAALIAGEMYEHRGVLPRPAVPERTEPLSSVTTPQTTRGQSRSSRTNESARKGLFRGVALALRGFGSFGK